MTFHFREIRPFSAIICRNSTEANALLDHLIQLNYRWQSNREITDCRIIIDDGTIYYIEDNEHITCTALRQVESISSTYTVYEFNQILTNNLTNAELIEWLQKNDQTETLKELFSFYNLVDVIHGYSPDYIANKINNYEYDNNKLRYKKKNYICIRNKNNYRTIDRILMTSENPTDEQIAEKFNEYIAYRHVQKNKYFATLETDYLLIGD